MLNILRAVKTLSKNVLELVAQEEEEPRVRLELPRPRPEYKAPYVERWRGVRPRFVTPEEWKEISPKTLSDLEEAGRKIEDVLRRIDEIQREKNEVLKEYSELWSRVSELQKKLKGMKAEQMEEIMKAMDILRREMREVDDLAYKFLKWEDKLVAFVERMEEIFEEPDPEEVLNRLLDWLKRTAPDVYAKANNYLKRVKREMRKRRMEISRWAAIAPLELKGRRAQLLTRVRDIWRKVVDFFRDLVNTLLDFVKEREVLEDEVEDATRELEGILAFV